MSIHNERGIRYRFPVMVVTDDGRSSRRGVIDRRDQWWINTRPSHLKVIQTSAGPPVSNGSVYKEHLALRRLTPPRRDKPFLPALPARPQRLPMRKPERESVFKHTPPPRPPKTYSSAFIPLCTALSPPLSDLTPRLT